MTAHVVDELQVARLVAAGKIKSPATFRGSLFISLRVSGVGIAWRTVGNWRKVSEAGARSQACF